MNSENVLTLLLMKKNTKQLYQQVQTLQFMADLQMIELGYYKSETKESSEENKS